MSTQAGAEAQHEYAVIAYFVPGNRLIKNRTGLDTTQRSVTLQNVVWSTSIQHGPGGARNIFERALASIGYPPNALSATAPTDAALVRAVYAERRAENGGRYFRSSTASVRASVVNRFHNEEADALRSLEQEIAAAQANPPTAEPTDNSAATPRLTPHTGAQ